MLLFFAVLKFAISSESHDGKEDTTTDFDIPPFLQVNCSSILIENQTLYTFLESEFEDSLNNSNSFFLEYLKSKFNHTDQKPKYFLEKAVELNHPLAKLLQDINKEIKLNKFNDIQFDDLNLSNHFLYDRFYLLNRFFYDFYSFTENITQFDIFDILGITLDHMHYIPKMRENSSCYQVYSLFRTHHEDEAIKLILLSDLAICTPILQETADHIDDPLILAYYIAKHDFVLALEFLRKVLPYHGLLRPLILHALLMENTGNIKISLEMNQILAHLGIDTALDNVFLLSKMVNSTIPQIYHTMKQLNEKIKICNAHYYINQSRLCLGNLDKSFSYINHASSLMLNGFYMKIRLKLEIIAQRIYISLFQGNVYNNIINIIRSNEDCVYVMIMLIILTILLKIRSDIVKSTY